MSTREKNVIEIIINSLRETQKNFLETVEDDATEAGERETAEEYLMSLKRLLWNLELEYNGKLDSEEIKGRRGVATLSTIAQSLYYETREPLCSILNDPSLPIEERIIASDKLKFVENVLAAIRTEYEESRPGTTAMPFDEMFCDKL